MGEMHENSDAQLLRDYVTAGNEAAFRELVSRHTDLVYSAAVRQVDSPDLACDIAQSVFTDLARKARPLAAKIAGTSSLAGWLHRSTRYAALNHLRDTRRRLANERQAMEQLLTDTDAPVNWEQIRPALDEALDSLADDDREALLLRYFKNQDFRTVGNALGVSDDTAQKRVSRAVDRLREFFAKRGVTVGASGLVVIISANAVQAAPAGLAATISTAVATVAATTLGSTATVTATKAIAMTTLQKSLITVTVAALAGAGIYEARQASALHGQVQRLQQQQAPLIQEARQLQNNFADATNRLADLLAENALLKSNSNQAELLRLRGEVSRLRQANAGTAGTDSKTSLMKSWLAREEKLRQVAEQYPDKRTPDMQLLSEQDWLNQAKDAKFDTEENIQRALANLRNAAANKFAKIASEAVKKYMAANNDQFPTDLAQLQPYFGTPISDAILSRWGIVPQSAYPNQRLGGDWLIAVKDPVDRELDSNVVIGPGSYGSSDYQSSEIEKAISILGPVRKAYAADHNGEDPQSPSAILPYLTTPELRAAFDSLMARVPKKN